MRNSGFTLIELMVAMVIGLTVVTSVYTLGAAMSKQFYEEQRLATSQGTSRVALLELRRDVTRAGLFGSPNGQREPTCDASPPTLPKLGGGTTPLGAFQYYADTDRALLDPSNNPESHADRLRMLASLYLTDQLLIQSADVNGDVIVLQSGNQAFRRTFAWGQVAGPFTSGSAPDYLDGTLDWDSAWAGESASWKGIAQKGARAFQTGSLLHIETPEGRHFFRSVFQKSGNTEDEIRIQVTPRLPVGTACLPGAAEGATVAPLQWVEYAVVDPFTTGDSEFFNFDGMFYIDLDPTNPAFALQNVDASAFRESPNRVLVRRILDSTTGTVRPSTTQVIAEFVTNFRVSFLMDTNSGNATPPSLSSDPITDSAAESAVNANPERVRSVLIELGIRNPIEDPDIKKLGTDGGTRFEVDPGQKGSARVRRMRIEIPVMNVARRNL